MAARVVQLLATAQNKTSQTSWSPQPTWAAGVAPTVGNVLICAIVSDLNSANGVGSAQGGGGPSGAGVSLWTRFGQKSIGSGISASGVIIALWAGMVDTAGATSLSVTFPDSIAAKAVGVFEVEGVLSPTVIGRSAVTETRDAYGYHDQNGSAGTPTVSIDLAPAGDLSLVVFGYEAAFAAASYAVPAGWTEAFEIGTTGGNAATNVGIHVGYLVTGTGGSGTVSPATFPSGSWVAMAINMKKIGYGWGIS